MPAIRQRKRLPKVALGVGIAVLVAVGIAGATHVLSSTSTEPAYSIDPASVALTTADVGPNFPLVNEGALGPSQHTAPGFPLPYQQYFLGGWARNFMIESALVPPGRTEIDRYSEQLGIQPSDPPTIIGPFVTDHAGLFEVSDFEISYHLASAAHLDYLVSHPGPEANSNYTANYDKWRTYPIQLGDEADAWGGIRDTPAKRDNYEEQTFRVRWRRGPVVSTVFIRGAHDLTLDSALHFAHIVDARIVSAMEHPAKGVSHAFNQHHITTSVSIGLAVRDVDRRTGQRLDWD
jgi:hypothetical protein